MIHLVLLVLLAIEAHAAPEVCNGVTCGGMTTSGLKSNYYCEVTSDNLFRTWAPGSVSSARECESLVADSKATNWYNYRSNGACELLKSCDNLLPEVNSVTGPDPGEGQSCFTQEVLLVIGGFTSVVKLKTVDVITEDLTVLSGVFPDAPVADDRWTAGLIDNQVIVCGGKGSGTECQHLDIETATWLTSTNMAAARHQAPSIVHNGNFFMLGGQDVTGLNSVEGYFPSFDTWCDIPEWQLPEPNYLFCAIEHENFVYIAGGVGIADSRAVRRLDTSTNLYETLPSSKWMLVPRHGHACVKTTIGGKEGILVTGGINGPYLSSTEFFSFDDQKWFALADMTTTRALHGLGVLNGQVIAFGGLDGSLTYLDSIEVYNEEDNQWETASSTLTDPKIWFAYVKIPEWTPE